MDAIILTQPIGILNPNVLSFAQPVWACPAFIKLKKPLWTRPPQTAEALEAV